MAPSANKGYLENFFISSVLTIEAFFSFFKKIYWANVYPFMRLGPHKFLWQGCKLSTMTVAIQVHPHCNWGNGSATLVKQGWRPEFTSQNHHHPCPPHPASYTHICFQCGLWWCMLILPTWRMQSRADPWGSLASQLGLISEFKGLSQLGNNQVCVLTSAHGMHAHRHEQAHGILLTAFFSYICHLFNVTNSPPFLEETQTGSWYYNT